MTTLPRVVVGSGEPSLTFVHGFTQTKTSWMPVATEMSVNHRCVLVDAPHHGDAQSLDVDFGVAAELVGDAARDSVLVGYSMGGRLALAAAVGPSSNLRALVLLSSTAGLDDVDDRQARREADDRLADRIESIGTEAFLEEWTSQPMFRHTSLTADDRSARLSNAPESLARSLRTCGTGVQPSLWSDLGAIKIPTLVVVGQSDTKFVEIGRRLHEGIPESEIALIHGAGHAVHLDQPHAFAQVLADFLSRRVRA